MKKSIGFTILSLGIMVLLTAGCASQPVTVSVKTSMHSGVFDILVTNSGSTTKTYIAVIDFFDASGNRLDQVTSQTLTAPPGRTVGESILAPVNATRYDPPALYAVTDGLPKRIDYTST